MAKKKSPFSGYTEEQVKTMENNYFCLVMGGDFVSRDSYYLFTRAEVSKLHKDTLKNLVSIAEDGEEKDRIYAMDLICGLKIQPMRLH